MFSFFRSKKSKTAALLDSSKRMTLDERKLFRKEMLYQSVRESFLGMEVVSSMYKFKVMAVDERHHRFIVMIDVAKSFVTGKSSKTKSFAALEQAMRLNAYKRFGVMIDGTYWRVSGTEEQFERFARATDTSGFQHLRVHESTPPEAAGRVLLARQNYQAVSEDETQAFMTALRSGQALPVVRVGEQEYQSDLAPLDGGIMIGGTQYGKL
jgi:hypothetical protein